MTNLGNIEIADLRLGASQVKAAYLGSEQIWGGEEPPVPYSPGIWIVKTDGTTLSATADQIGKTNFNIGSNSYIINTLGVSSPKTEISAFIDAYEPGDGITTLTQRAFEDTRSIEKVVLPSVTSITKNYTYVVNNSNLTHPQDYKLKEIHMPSLTAMTTYVIVNKEPNLEVFAANLKSVYDDSMIIGTPKLQKVWTENEVYKTVGDGYGNLSSIIVERSTGKAIIAANARTKVYSTEVSSLGTSVYQGISELRGSQDYAPPLLSVDFPNASNIGRNAFAFQSNLKYVHLPNATTFADWPPFEYCGALIGEFVLDFRGRTLNTVPTLAISGSDTFRGCPAGYQIVVPDSLYTAWTTASNWSVVASHIITASDYEAQLGS